MLIKAVAGHYRNPYGYVILVQGDRKVMHLLTGIIGKNAHMHREEVAWWIFREDKKAWLKALKRLQWETWDPDKEDDRVRYRELIEN